MALANISGHPIRFLSFPYERGAAFAWTNLYAGTTLGTIDAAAEKFAFIGNIYICDRSASKTLSSAGGKIHWLAGASSTFAAAAGATTIDVGFQDTTQASAFRQPDGTFDTKGTLVSATDTITSSAINTVTLSTGSKTVTDGMKASIVFDMTARGGADSVRIAGAVASSSAYVSNPGIAQNLTGTWSVTAAGSWSVPVVLIEFDDGTFGIFQGGMWAPFSQSTHASVQSSTNPDEYGLRFTVPFKCQLWGVELPIIAAGGAASGTVGVIRVSSGAASSPTVLTSENVDGFDYFANGASQARMFRQLTSPQTLSPGTTYYVTFRSSSTATFTFLYLAYPSNAQLAPLPFGVDGYKVSRDGDTVGTAAFTEVTTDLLPVNLLISQFDDGAGAGGGGLLTHPGMGGGMRG